MSVKHTLSVICLLLCATILPGCSSESGVKGPVEYTPAEKVAEFPDMPMGADDELIMLGFNKKKPEDSHVTGVIVRLNTMVVTVDDEWLAQDYDARIAATKVFSDLQTKEREAVRFIGVGIVEIGDKAGNLVGGVDPNGVVWGKKVIEVASSDDSVSDDSADAEPGAGDEPATEPEAGAADGATESP